MAQRQLGGRNSSLGLRIAHLVERDRISSRAQRRALSATADAMRYRRTGQIELLREKLDDWKDRDEGYETRKRSDARAKLAQLDKKVLETEKALLRTRAARSRSWHEACRDAAHAGIELPYVPEATPDERQLRMKLARLQVARAVRRAKYAERFAGPPRPSRAKPGPTARSNSAEAERGRERRKEKAQEKARKREVPARSRDEKIELELRAFPFGSASPGAVPQEPYMPPPPSAEFARLQLALDMVEYPLSALLDAATRPPRRRSNRPPGRASGGVAHPRA